MKNIFLIPTDKPSRLHHYDYETPLAISKEFLNWRQARNIYITSDKDVKEGDWFMSDFNSFPLHNIKKLSEREGTLGWEQKDLKNNLKIILTTDQDLIKDGVQSIPDEFLEWFVKNPTCEWVRIAERFINKDYDSAYVIIIPKEEPLSFSPFDKEKSETITKEGQKVVSELQNILQHKTIEEAAKQSDKSKCKHFRREHTKEEVYDSFEEGFIDGANWQQEQDKNKYSEEEVFRIVTSIFHTPTLRDGSWEDIVEWFEQFKKKRSN
jgi:hypothetical protein